AAIFKLAEDKKVSLEKAWALISQNPADALGLADRGRLCEGMRADVILVDAARTKTTDITATIAHGKIACLKDHRLFTSDVISPQYGTIGV
ncbi:MAG: alpha-D-ribose 1-methylphosphonate 5-triphosphate diphosphatase, partial [Alphaproteobacteria bacterium]